MTTLNQLLDERGIRQAVIIDDAFDNAPRIDELSEDDWSVFFDDLDADGHAFLAQLYPPYEVTDAADLRIDQEFISSLWKDRENLPGNARNTLFEDYERSNTAEQSFLTELVDALMGFGLTCSTMGREFDPEANAADLVFIDLFLGFHQSDEDIDRAINRVGELVRERTQNPPLVVLMSRSTRLWEKRNEFRDRAGLLGSVFRVVGKNELADRPTLERVMTRLAAHYEDARRFAEFIYSWDTELDRAKEKFIQLLRRLDLPDLAQIRSLLLDFEGQGLGEYLLDVADRVLQHEIESSSETINAAIELNKIELNRYPAPHLTGSPDLQQLVHRMVFQHVERLRLSDSDCNIPLQFGDLLQIKDRETGSETENVLLIVTPACDLARGATDYILVLPGVLKPLAPADWSYGSTAMKTPIYEGPDGSRFWIKWNVKGRHTAPATELIRLLSEPKGFSRIGRMRDLYAIEIQQAMLAEMGRVGQLANPPASFPVSLTLYVISPDGTPVHRDIPQLAEAVCFVGRGNDPKRVDHLVLSEQACDSLRNEIKQLAPGEVHTNARNSLQAIKEDLDFFDRFEKGLVNVPLKNNSLVPEKGTNDLLYLHLVRNEWKGENEPVKGNHRNSPIVIKICDLEPGDETDEGS